MAFNSLSLELNEQIATFLHTDRDACNFRLICHATNAAVDSYRCGVWRDRYAQRYDMPEKKGGREISMLYKLRSKLLRKSAKFMIGQEPREIRCMEILRDLVVESYAHLPIGRKAKHLSNNLREIQNFVQRSDMLRMVFYSLQEKSNINPLLQTLQLVLTHLQLNIPSVKASPALGFAYSQFAVYSHPDDFPLFNANGTWQISTNLLVHIANFFKHHLTQKGEDTLYKLFSRLKEHEKPKAWKSRLVQGGGVMKLGKHWKGTYAYLHDLYEMDLIRQFHPGKEYFFTDSIDHHDGFQTLKLDFEPEANRTRWPKVFESHLNAMPTKGLCKRLDKASKPRPRAIQVPQSAHQPMAAYNWGNIHEEEPPQEPLSPPGTPGVNRVDIELPPPPVQKPSSPTSPTFPKRGVHYHQFSGIGNDAEPFHCSGILHPLPPQEDIPGWYRISMMKYFDPLAQPDSMPPQSGTTWAPFQSPPSEGNTPHVPNKLAGADYNLSDKYQVDDDAQINAGCWAYEGVVLPGGMIMLGRWWSPMDDTGLKRCMGPFIFWNVDKDD